MGVPGQYASSTGWGYLASTLVVRDGGYQAGSTLGSTGWGTSSVLLPYYWVLPLAYYRTTGYYPLAYRVLPRPSPLSVLGTT